MSYKNEIPGKLLTFTETMEANLAEKQIPAKLFGQDLVALLLEFAIEFLQGCLQKKSSMHVAKEMQNLSFVQKFILKRRLARKVYRGNFSYKANHGDETVDALLKTCQQFSTEDLKEIVDYVDMNDVPEVNPDPIPVDLPSL